MHGEGRHAWQGACVAGCVCGRCMCGRGCAWQRGHVCMRDELLKRAGTHPTGMHSF